MFEAMARRHIPISINSTTNEKAILTRNGKSSSTYLFENMFKGTHPANSVVESGDLIGDGESFYLVESTRKTPDGDKSSMLLKCNQTVDIKRFSQGLDSNLNPTNTWTITFSNVKVSAEYITGALRAKDAGLLANTVLRILMQKTLAYMTYNDPGSDFVVSDRITLGTSNYQVTAIDAVIMTGLLIVQVAEDLRQ